MPFQSKAQMGWMFANKPEMAKAWAAHTPDPKHLPEHVKKHAVRQALLHKMGAK